MKEHPVTDWLGLQQWLLLQKKTHFILQHVWFKGYFRINEAIFGIKIDRSLGSFILHESQQNQSDLVNSLVMA